MFPALVGEFFPSEPPGEVQSLSERVEALMHPENRAPDSDYESSPLSPNSPPCSQNQQNVQDLQEAFKTLMPVFHPEVEFIGQQYSLDIGILKNLL